MVMTPVDTTFETALPESIHIPLLAARSKLQLKQAIISCTRGKYAGATIATLRQQECILFYLVDNDYVRTGF